MTTDGKTPIPENDGTTSTWAVPESDGIGSPWVKLGQEGALISAAEAEAIKTAEDAAKVAQDAASTATDAANQSQLLYGQYQELYSLSTAQYVEILNTVPIVEQAVEDAEAAAQRAEDAANSIVTIDPTLYYDKVESDARFAPVIHTHTVADISDSLRLMQHTVISRASADNLPGLTSGHFNVGDGLSNPDGSLFQDSWHHVLHLRHGDEDIFAVQIAAPYPFVSHNNLYWRREQVTAGEWSPWYKIWHETNDGAGSGLDADLLDGQHANAFALTTDLTGKVAKTGDVMSGPLTLGSVNNALIVLDKAAGNFVNAFDGSTAGVLRWRMILGTETAETGGDAGSDFYLYRGNDAGQLQWPPAIVVTRKTGVVTASYGLTLPAPDPVAATSAVHKGYVDTRDALKANLAGGNVLAGTQVVDGGAGFGELFVTTRGTTPGQVQLDLLTKSASPTNRLGSATAKGWSFVALSDAFTGPEKNHLALSAWTGTAWVNPWIINPTTGVQAFSASPTAPTPALGDNSSKLATTAFVLANGGGGGGGTTDWSAITNKPSTFPPSTHSHPQSEVTSLVTDLAAKAPLASPALTGVPTAPTAAVSSNTTQLATTAFVQNAVAVKAPLASPALTGVPTAPTAAAGTSTSQIATTAFVMANGSGGGGLDLVTADERYVNVTGDVMTSALGIMGTEAAINLTKAAGSNTAGINVYTGDYMRWAIMFSDYTEETGGNTGSDCTFMSFDDSGWAPRTAMQIMRATGNVVAHYGVTLPAANPVAATDAAHKGYVDTKAPLVHTHAQADITNLVSDLNLKAPKNSPSFSGDPTAPTQLPANASQRIATTLFVKTAIASQDTGFGHGQCRLHANTMTSLLLLPVNGDKLIINGKSETIPAAGVTVTNAGLSAGTTYLVFAKMNGAVMELELGSQTLPPTRPAWAATKGVAHKTGDVTRTLVGMVHTGASSDFVNGLGSRYVASYFNRRRVSISASVNNTTSGATVPTHAGAGQCHALSWDDSIVHMTVSGFAYSSVSLGTTNVQIQFYDYYSTPAKWVGVSGATAAHSPAANAFCAHATSFIGETYQGVVAFAPFVWVTGASGVFNLSMQGDIWI